MMYEQVFDESTVGAVSFPVEMYTALQDGLVRLRDDLSAWGTSAREAGATRSPCERDVDDLRRTIDVGERQLGSAVVDVTINAIYPRRGFLGRD